jgi:hypothetical protein
LFAEPLLQDPSPTGSILQELEAKLFPYRATHRTVSDLPQHSRAIILHDLEAPQTLQRKLPVRDASFGHCPNSDRTKHSGKDPAMRGIQRVPIDKTAQSRRVENGSLADIGSFAVWL